MTVLFVIFLVMGFSSVVWHLWVALTTGKVRKEIWFGADKREDHYGFVARVIGLVIMLGGLIYFAVQLPSLIEVLGE
ncbi:MAG: hypothetical protein V4808_13770 [Pseudomonadota bacterium]